jgi:hypothetical protein
VANAGVYVARAYGPTAEMERSTHPGSMAAAKANFSALRQQQHARSQCNIPASLGQRDAPCLGLVQDRIIRGSPLAVLLFPAATAQTYMSALLIRTGRQRCEGRMQGRGSFLIADATGCVTLSGLSQQLSAPFKLKTSWVYSAGPHAAVGTT